jgi:elongation factor P
MLDYNAITPKKVITLEGEPYIVLTSHVFRKQQRKPVNQTKLKHLITGKVTEYSFHQSEKAEEAELEKKDITFLYNNRGEWWFCEGADRSKRFSLPEDILGEQGKFLKQNSALRAVIYNNEIISLDVPIKVELKVSEAPPAVKGDTAQGGMKQLTLETGAVINGPMFLNEGDIIRVNTETGEYVERVEKR